MSCATLPDIFGHVDLEDLEFDAEPELDAFDAQLSELPRPDSEPPRSAIYPRVNRVRPAFPRRDR